MIPLCDLQQQYLSLKDPIDEAMQRVALDCHYILGPNVRALEHEIAQYCDCEYGIGVANGTDALHLALRALDIGPGDEVITTPFTFVATTEAIGIVGATPVFVDIDTRTFNIDPDLIESAITRRTRVILPVHLYGQPCDMDRIVAIADKHGLHIVEDCAQAIGATYLGRKMGSFGAAGCLSFFPSKNLGCFGDGGMVVTNDQQLYERIEVLRRHGGKLKYHHEELGLNSRLDELQATVLRVKFPHLEQWNHLRRQHALYYNNQLATAGVVQLPHELADGPPCVPRDDTADTSIRHVYHQYTIQVPQRDRVAKRLSEAQIGNAVYYPVPLHLQRVHAHLGHRPGSFPEAESAAQRCLSLPMFPELTSRQQDEVIVQLRTICAELTVTTNSPKDL